MGKHAYLIVANSNFLVLETCLRLLDDIRNDIYLLLDKKIKVKKETLSRLNEIVKISTLHIYNDMVVNWGGGTQIYAALFLMEETIKSKYKNYDYVHFFQGSDLPIKSQDQIHAFFDEQNDIQFVNIQKKSYKMAINKCHYRHFFCDNRFFRTNKFIKALNFGLVEIQKILRIRKNLDIALFQGSALFSITGDCVSYVLSRKDEIKKRFRFSLAADEVFLQSILMDSCYKEKISKIDTDSSSNARLIDRSRPDGKNSPHVWRTNEFDYIINQPNEICFARKFDEKVDYEIAKKIYDYIKQE